MASPLAAPLFLEAEAAYDIDDEAAELPDNRWAWSLSSKYSSTAASSEAGDRQGVPAFVDDPVPQSRRGRVVVSKKVGSDPWQPGMWRSAAYDDTGPQRDTSQDVVVSGRHSIAMGEGLTNATVGTAASFTVHGSDRTSRPILPVGLLSSVLVVQIVGPTTVRHKVEPLKDGSVRIWFTAEVSGRYTLRVGVRVGGGTARIEPIAGSPFTLEVAPTKVLTPRRERGERTDRAERSAERSADRGVGGGGSGHGGGGKKAWRRGYGAGDSNTGGAFDEGWSSSLPASLSPTLTSLASLGGIRASDVRLRAPRGLLAHAKSGEAARLELLAPLIGGGRVELPGRMKCILHLQHPWFDPDEIGEGHADYGGDGGESGGSRGRGKGRGGRGGGRSGGGGRGERYFSGRIAFAPHAMQPGTHQLHSPTGRSPPMGRAPPSVYEEPLHENVSALLQWGGESSSLGGTLLFASFNVRRAGNYLVHVTLDQSHVQGSPIVLRVSPGETSAAKSYAAGSGLKMSEAGRHETIGVWLRDEFGNNRRHSDEPIAGELSASIDLINPSNGGAADTPLISASGGVGGGSGGGDNRASSATASVSRLADGSYAVGYVVREAGVWALSLALDGVPIGKSPYAISVHPAPLHPPSCHVFGQLHAAIAGLPGEIFIVAHDRLGNRVREGGARFDVQLLSIEDPKAPPINGHIHDHGDGRYSGRYTLTAVGRHALSITSTLDGAAVRGSPFLITVTPAEPNAGRSAIVVPKQQPLRPAKSPTKGGSATRREAWGEGAAAEVAARATDAARDAWRGGGHLIPAVRAYPAPDLLLRAGSEFFLGIRVADVFGNAAPFDANLLEVSVAEQGGLVGPGGTSRAPPTEYSVRAISEHLREKSAEVRAAEKAADAAGTVVARGAAGAERAARALAHMRHKGTKGGSGGAAGAEGKGGGKGGGGKGGDAAGEGGSGLLLVRIYRSGIHEVSVRLGAIELPGSPVLVQVEAAAVAARESYIAHDALRAAAEASGGGAASTGGGGVERAAALTLLTADSWGNPLTTGGGPVGAKLSGPGACATSVEDHHDGSYTVSWAAALSGSYRLSVLVGGAHVQGSPFNVHVDVAGPGSPKLPPPSPRLAQTNATAIAMQQSRMQRVNGRSRDGRSGDGDAATHLHHVAPHVAPFAGDGVGSPVMVSAPSPRLTASLRKGQRENVWR